MESKDGSSLAKSKLSQETFHKYIVIAMISGITFLVCMLVFFIFLRFEGFSKIWEKIMKILMPFIVGLGLAYVLNPVMIFCEKWFCKLFGKKIKNEKRKQKFSRVVGVSGSILFLILLIFLLLEMLIPQLYESLKKLVLTAPTEVNNFMDWINHVFSSESEISKLLGISITEATQFVNTWIEEHLLSQMNTYISSITSGVVSVAKGFLNFVIGIIISIYLLLSKETFIGQTKKIIYTIFSPRAGNKIISTARKSNEIFGGFIAGKILDSVIIGLLCYICSVILNFPYALLVSVIVGVTNVIPFFGPYIGAVPSAIIIILANPIKGLYFIIFIIILQQIDGNIIGPKILGDSTGLSAFWVVFAILVAGGLFGFVGMLLGVPTFAVIYNIVGEIVENHLKKKQLPTSTEEYIGADKIDVVTKKVIYLDGESNE